MAQLVVRNLDEEVVRRLKLRAAQNHRSAEAEHRAILQAALLGEAAFDDFKAALAAMPNVGEDSDFERHRDRGRAVELFD